MKPKLKAQRKIILFSFTLVLLAMLTVGSTVAYMIAKTNTQNNKFDPGVANIEISEPNDSSYVINSDSTVNKVVAITNKNNPHAVPVYVRVKLVPILRNMNGEGTGESVNVTYPSQNTTNWTSEINGYYYYKGILKPGTATESLINKAKVEGGLPKERKIEIQVIADSIQAVGNAEQDAWGMKYNNSSWQVVG
jgi:hypothetical protein